MTSTDDSELLRSAAAALFSTAPKGFEKVICRVDIIRLAERIEAVAHVRGKTVSMVVWEEVLGPLRELRESMYRRQRSAGAWYTARLTVTGDGKFSVDFDYDTKPDFGLPDAENRFDDDLKHHPRK